MKRYLLFFTVFINLGIYSFPGDHNTLTCIDHLFYEKDSSGNVVYNEQLKQEYYKNFKVLQDPTKLDSEKDVARQNIKIILSGIQNQKEFLTSSLEVKNSIKSHHNFGTDITKWGDSLSDLVDLYGMVPYNFFGFTPSGDYGNEQGFIDSFGDYFTIFGNSYGDPFTVNNYATSTEKTEGLLKRVNVVPQIINNFWDVDPSDSHCVANGTAAGLLSRGEVMSDPSSMRSVVMIGGNDILFSAWLPFIDKYKVERTLDNIILFIDWNIENGKQVLLEGTIPVYSESLPPYNSAIVNRKALCSPLEDSLIEADEVPWWIKPRYLQGNVKSNRGLQYECFKRI